MSGTKNKELPCDFGEHLLVFYELSSILTKIVFSSRFYMITDDDVLCDLDTITVATYLMFKYKFVCSRLSVSQEKK